MTCAQKIFDVEKQAREEGIARGEALFISLARALLEQNRIDDLKAAAENPEARELLYQEFGLR